MKNFHQVKIQLRFKLEHINPAGNNFNLLGAGKVLEHGKIELVLYEERMYAIFSTSADYLIV